MPRSPAPCLTWYTEFRFRRTLTVFCNQGLKLWKRIHLLQLLIVNEYAARYCSLGCMRPALQLSDYAVACHLVDVDE